MYNLSFKFSWSCDLVVIGFFFFKQKTAYDRRISDWSSDVCSSDLAQPIGRDLGGAGLREDVLHLREARDHAFDLALHVQRLLDRGRWNTQRGDRKSVV